jgi:hypothetical protein
MVSSLAHSAMAITVARQVRDQDAECFPISLLGSAHELVVHRLDPFRRRNSSLR